MEIRARHTTRTGSAEDVSKIHRKLLVVDNVEATTDPFLIVEQRTVERGQNILQKYFGVLC